MNNEDQDQFALLGGTGGFNIGNFDPSSIQEDEVILMTIAMDVSPSVRAFEKELNEAFTVFVEEMQHSHVADRLMVKVIEFNEKVVEKTGFMPIKQVDPKSFVFRAKGDSTALVDAAMKAVQSTVDYRSHLEATGINVKTLVFVITDGAENSSSAKFADVATLLDTIDKEERNIFSFETILFGIGGDPTSYQQSQQKLHFKHLAVVGQSGKEIRKMIGFISASVSKSSSNQAITF